MHHRVLHVFSMPLIAALFAAVCATGCSAASPEMITINGESKFAAGVLTEAQAGDVACYLSLKADDGTEFQESAAFEICEDTGLIGKRLKLSYSVENVLAAECEGDVDCGKSDQIVLVTAVRVIE